MTSIVVELQRDSLNPSVAVSDLLRKALLIATKLDIPEFKVWIEKELSGYRDSTDFPPYRISHGTVMGQDEWGRWIPVFFENAEQATLVSKVVFFDSIAEIEALIERTIRGKSGSLSIDFPPEQQAILRRCSQNGLVRHTRYIRVEDLKGILDTVRTELLKWSLKLEKDGILGDGLTFSPDDQRKASAIHHVTHFHAPVGNVAQGAEHVSQMANVGIRPEDLARLVTEFTTHLDELNLDNRQKQRAEAQLAILNAELAGEPDQGIVRQAGRTLWNITQGAIGSLIATAATRPEVWQWIRQMLASL